MQCPSCRAVYSNGLDLCPRCKTPAAKAAPDPQPKSNRPQTETHANPSGNHRSEAASKPATEANAAGGGGATPQAQAASTLIEFPGAGRANRPQWRKELSERVREIQERRARDAEREAHGLAQRKLDQPASPLPASSVASSAASSVAPPTPQLGLVPQPDAPAVNPIVAAALKRIERARQPPIPSRARGGGAAAAVARVAEEQFEDEAQPENLIVTAPMPAPMHVPAPPTAQATSVLATATEKTTEPLREHGLVVVQSPPPQPQAAPPPVQVQKTEPVRNAVASVAVPSQAKSQPKRVFAKAVDDAVLDRLEETAPLSAGEPYDDHAPVLKRLAGALIDLLVIAFASTPFAAIIELTNGNWMDIRVASSMGGIILLVMFLYLAASTALTGRTWGMSLVSLRAVDANTGDSPTTWQAIGRALLYMLSLATAGLGILYALFDAEGRTAHDRLSRTAVVRE
jgi:uncharacterized RDD family membrane protein YckC